MSESPLNLDEVEKIKTFICQLSEELCRILERPEIDLDQLFPQYAPFQQNKELQGDPELDEKGG